MSLLVLIKAVYSKDLLQLTKLARIYKFMNIFVSLFIIKVRIDIMSHLIIKWLYHINNNKKNLVFFNNDLIKGEKILTKLK